MVNMMLRWRNIIIFVVLFILVREKSQSGEIEEIGRPQQPLLMDGYNTHISRQLGEEEGSAYCQ